MPDLWPPFLRRPSRSSLPGTTGAELGRNRKGANRWSRPAGSDRVRRHDAGSRGQRTRGGQADPANLLLPAAEGKLIMSAQRRRTRAAWEAAHPWLHYQYHTISTEGQIDPAQVAEMESRDWELYSIVGPVIALDRKWDYHFRRPLDYDLG
jgi:hypothetical protein